MVPFSEILKRVHVTAQHLVADSQPNATAACGLVLAVWPLRGSGLTCIVDAVNACTMFPFRLMPLDLILFGLEVS